MVRELQRASVDRQFVSLPHTGAILATLVQVQISSSATDTTKYLKQAMSVRLYEIGTYGAEQVGKVLCV